MGKTKLLILTWISLFIISTVISLQGNTIILQLQEYSSQSPLVDQIYQAFIKSDFYLKRYAFYQRYEPDNLGHFHRLIVTSITIWIMAIVTFIGGIIFKLGCFFDRDYISFPPYISSYSTPTKLIQSAVMFITVIYFLVDYTELKYWNRYLFKPRTDPIIELFIFFIFWFGSIQTNFQYLFYKRGYNRITNI